MRTRLSRLWSTLARGGALRAVHGAACRMHGVRGIRTLHRAPGTWQPSAPLLAAACLVSALGVQAADRTAAEKVRLESIVGRIEGATAAVLIQTSEPVPYVTANADPSTVLIDLRNVTSVGVSNRFAAGGDGITGVSVEDTTAFDGTPIARVRISFARPLAHRVRSTRNVIRVEVDRDRVAANAAAPASPADVAPKAARTIRSVRAAGGPGDPVIVLEGDGVLKASNVELTAEPPYRLVLDFDGVESTAKAVTTVRNDPVVRVRIARHSAKPLVTRVVVDLIGSTAYRVDQSEVHALAIVFGRSAGSVPREDVSAPVVDPAAGQTPGPAADAVRGGVNGDGPPDTADLLRRLRAAQEQQAGSVPQAAPPAAAVPPAPAAAAPAPGAASSQSPVGPSAGSPPPVAAAPSSSPATPGQPPVTAAAPPASRALAPEKSGDGAQALAGTTEQQQPGAPKKYTGLPIGLDFAGADIRQVLRVFGEASGLNIIIDPKVQGVVDVALRDVPWDQAFDVILKSASLGYSIDGNVVRIAPLEVLANEEKQRQNLAEAQALAGTLETMTRTLSYGSAKDLRNVLQSSQLLTKRGQIQVDERTNTMIIRDLPTALPGVSQVIDTLDRPQPQVEIEARIVQTTRNFARQLGVKWGFSGRVDPALGNTTGLAFPNSGSLGGRTGAASATGVTPAVNLPTTAPATSAVGLSLGSVNGSFNLDVELTALESQGKGRILSTPRVVALNNFQAEMMQGVQIPIQTVANNTVTVQFKDAALKLDVTPQVNANQTIIMNIQLENATPDYTKQVNNIPPINTQKAITQVLADDNQTIVIGGVFVSREQTQNDHTPGLSKIPLLGWLFRRDSIDDESNELLIFLTPRIIKR